jgi:hypothetical protein
MAHLAGDGAILAVGVLANLAVFAGADLVLDVSMLPMLLKQARRYA